MLLTEFDANRQAIINPEALHEPLEGFPKIAVSCFSRLTFQRMQREPNSPKRQREHIWYK